MFTAAATRIRMLSQRLECLDRAVGPCADPDHVSGRINAVGDGGIGDHAQVAVLYHLVRRLQADVSRRRRKPRSAAWPAPDIWWIERQLPERLENGDGLFNLVRLIEFDPECSQRADEPVERWADNCPGAPKKVGSVKIALVSAFRS